MWVAASLFFLGGLLHTWYRARGVLCNCLVGALPFFVYTPHHKVIPTFAELVVSTPKQQPKTTVSSIPNRACTKKNPGEEEILLESTSSTLMTVAPRRTRAAQESRHELGKTERTCRAMSNARVKVGARCWTSTRKWDRSHVRFET